MQTKKIIGIALAAALVSSMAVTTSLTAFAGREEIPSDELKDYTSNHTFGIVGGFTNWEAGKDIAMSDADGDGVFVGVVNNLAAGEYEFKVRADNDPDWNDSWGEYEADRERTMNSQTNCKIKAETNVDLVVAIDTNGAEATVWPVAYFTVANEGGDPAAEGKFKDLGVIGKFNDWSADVDMTNNGGIYSAAIGNLEAESEFKIRADKSWEGTLSWGDYEEEYERTQNSQQNVKTSEAAKNVTVFLGTNGKDLEVWPLVYMYTDAEGKLKVVDTSIPEKAEEQSQTSEESQTSQTSEESQTSQTSEESQTSEASQTSEESTEEPSVAENYETQITDYIYFDNSETKWDTVYAYWWQTDYARTYDLENNDYGWGPAIDEETGEEVNKPTMFPGTPMTQIEGTDIWQARIPFGATMIIFNSGKSDEQIHNGETGYQTADLKFDQVANAGQIFKIDTSVEAKAGRGIEKTKYKYNEGSWSTYEGKFNSEVLKPSSVVSDPSTPSGGSTTDPSGTTGTTSTVSTVSNASTASTTSTTKTTSTTSTTSTVEAPATGDVAMAAAFIAVAAAALGAVVLASKKKRV